LHWHPSKYILVITHRG